MVSSCTPPRYPRTNPIESRKIIDLTLKLACDLGVSMFASFQGGVSPKLPEIPENMFHSSRIRECSNKSS